MSDVRESDSAQPSAANERPAHRRIWFPIAWPLLLALVCVATSYAAVDRGVVNSVVYASIAMGLLGLAVWTVRSSGWSRRLRWSLALALVMLPAAVALQLTPIKPILDGDLSIVGWRWRWADPDLNLAVPVAKPRATLAWRETPQDYPRFLGTGDWARVDGVELETDWKAHPPKLLWKQPIGAGWSSFAIVGDYAVTQEQRGDSELVVCYELRTGSVAWTHSDPVRWDPSARGALGGIGPRATPTVHQGLVITQGSTGIVNCLDARTGKPLWSHDTFAETGADGVMWGKANSPLVVDDRVVISVGGPEGGSLVAYELKSGEQAWAVGNREASYASPILTTLCGVRQIISLDEGAVTSHDASDGRPLWEFPWASNSDADAAVSQPVPVGDDRVFLSKGYSMGAELVQISLSDDGVWNAASVWKNPSVLRTKMCNVVVHDGYVYGLNDAILQCVDLETGRSRWKKRRVPRFGHGQILQVGEVILLLSEDGELILFEASPQKFRELASMQAIEGVTWNNPALAGDLLLVRNATEAACFELPLKRSAADAEAVALGGAPVRGQ